ncbi:MAG: hypothetical protein U0W24_18525 [Bacteroidales bacterium]
MARQKGPMKYVGTIGDIRHFKIKGSDGFFAGMVGGPSAEQIKTDPAFKRTRENMIEFGGAANAAKAVRVAFNQILKTSADPRITGRLTGIMKKINKEDGSEARGQRAILITQVPQYIKGTEFNKKTALAGVFNAPFTVTPNAQRNSVDLSIPAFNPLNYINAPAGATHFRIIHAVGAVSDFAYNSVSQSYEPIDANQNQLSNVAYSDYLSVSANIGTVTTITSALPGAPVLSSDVTLLDVVGIEFYQEVGTEYYLFASGNAAKIYETF